MTNKLPTCREVLTQAIREESDKKKQAEADQNELKVAESQKGNGRYK